ncbi:hypothetical protein [uncultured Porticoccus sp.]|uniref:hypothetical protein n=1 Tax=uncultured Porticoccus sp. TaxID=1256050 RepID=UPI002610AD74|nr:hypothetical protein [uncultured Porticoccus sp.]
MGTAVLFFAVDAARVVGFFADAEVFERRDWATVGPFAAGFLPGVFALFAALAAGCLVGVLALDGFFAAVAVAGGRPGPRLDFVGLAFAVRAVDFTAGVFVAAELFGGRPGPRVETVFVTFCLRELIFCSAFLMASVACLCSRFSMALTLASAFFSTLLTCLAIALVRFLSQDCL